ncbi:MAG: hydroxylamine oxidoreductase [Candidatus Hydrogenedentes bacterium]|nr:hydroxylamine oxidoreductase [Candidatus Hydrogenedentota bacterium]
MMRLGLIAGLTLAVAAGVAAQEGGPVPGAGYVLPQLSKESKECADCHKVESPSIYREWGSSKHFRGNIGCMECHRALKDDPDAWLHEGQYISVVVSPKDCARCHPREVEEFSASHHSKGARILGSLDNTLAEVVEGNRGMITAAFPEGVSAAAVNGCWQCHGTEIKILPGGRPDPATWPNTGIGRINPDGSEGSCSACHSRHQFSVEQVRQPENCGKCHMGPDHPQIEIYNESKHGIAFRANINEMALANEKWIVGEDYSAAPTCATCHMSATKNLAVTHDVGTRISWNNRPAVSVRPEVADEKLGLPGKDLTWQARRENMKQVCLSCHNVNFFDSFYTQYDQLIELYHAKFAKPGLELMTAAKPLLSPVEFSNAIEFVWYEIWHHEGRRARHGASMMGPDITHWHGTYEVAKHFYTEFIPGLQELAEKNAQSEDAAKKTAAAALQAKLDEVLSSDNHKWFLNKMDPAEVELRKKRQEEFKARYETKK